MREPALMLRRTYVLPPTVTLTVAGDEAVLLDLTDETMFSLNGTGARVVGLLTAGEDVAGAIDLLAAEYAVDRAQLVPDVDRLIAALVAARLLQPLEPISPDE